MRIEKKSTKRLDDIFPLIPFPPFFLFLGDQKIESETKTKQSHVLSSVACNNNTTPLAEIKQDQMKKYVKKPCQKRLQQYRILLQKQCFSIYFCWMGTILLCQGQELGIVDFYLNYHQHQVDRQKDCQFYFEMASLRVKEKVVSYIFSALPYLPYSSSSSI